MRIHRLELQSFGPFAGREEVDFTDLNEAGLFLLDGPTGAGKSTVLAGICFALYGSVPGRRSPESLASTQAPLGSRPEVLLDFTIGARRFEIRRWPKYRRPAKRAAKDGDGLTDEKAGAVLREHRDGEWHEVSVRSDEIGHLLREHLFLDAEQFQRVVMLPQGEFATFLRAESKEKEALLRKLFGTGRFDGVETSLAERFKALDQEVRRDRDLVAQARADLVFSLREGLGERWWDRLDADGAQGGPDKGPDDGRKGEPEDGPEGEPEDWSDAVLAGRASSAVATELSDSQDGRHQAVAAVEAAQRTVHEMGWRRQDLLAARSWQDRTDQHRARADDLAADRAAVDAHRAAVPLDRRATEADASARDHRASVEALDEAAVRLRSHGRCQAWSAGHAPAGQPDAGDRTPTGDTGDRGPAADFEALRQRAERELDRVADRERDAVALNRLEAEQSRLREEIDRLAEVAATADADRATAAELHRLLQQRLEDLAAPAAGCEAARSAVEQATAVRDAARRHARDRAAQTETEDALRQATDRAQAAVDAWHAVVEKRLAGAAALLAAELRSGEPCPVCGAAEHPTPAAPGGAEISAEAQERARARMEECAARRRQAEAAVDQVRGTAEASRVAAGGLSLGDAEAALQRAAAAVATAEQAAAELAETRASDQRAVQDQEAQAAAADRARRETAVAETRLAAAAEEAGRLAEGLAEALGEHGDLAGVRRELEDAKDRVDTALDAARREATSRSLSAQAAEHWTRDLRASAFATAEDVRSALLSAEEEARRGAAVREGDREEAALAELAVNPSVVRGLELAAQGIEPPSKEDLAQDQKALAAAERIRDAAAERAGALESLQKLVRRQAGVLEEVAERSAGQLAAVEETEALLRLVRGAGENSYKMTLGSYVLAGRLEAVVAAATERLLGMTQGRYELRHDDSVRGRGIRGLDITVVDRYTETERAAATLSGGETFMASLALALGLADTVQAEAGGVDMDTLFVDEGFGSLDAATLADVMEVLDGLQAGGRAIGLVSHVERMKQDIGYRLEVLKTTQGSHLRVRVPDRV
jgi:DNA repair protein SbcC/Rad50